MKTEKEKEKKYKLNFFCDNCGNKFKKLIPFGEDVKTFCDVTRTHSYTGAGFSRNYIHCPNCGSESVIKVIE